MEDTTPREAWNAEVEPVDAADSPDFDPSAADEPAAEIEACAPSATQDVARPPDLAGDDRAEPVRLQPTQDPTPDAQSIIEALLFASDAPLSEARLADLLGAASPAAVREHIDALNRRYEAAGLSFRVEAIARGYQLMTLPQFKPWLARLMKQHADTRLGDAALEALSIIAYKQPIIRADIDAIRGVASSEVVSRLKDLGLVKVVGRAEVIGRPMLYGTTRQFLDLFGLADLNELPPMEALKLRPRPLSDAGQDEPRRAAAGA